MFGICWPAIHPNVRAKAPFFLVLLSAFVAIPAERLQLAQPEPIPVATMGLDMIGDHAFHHDALFEVPGAERMQAELVCCDLLPTAETVPVARICGMLHGRLVQ